MRVVLFGASGMVGQAVLRACLLDAQVTEVLSVVRSPSGRRDAKLREILHGDFHDFEPIAHELTGLDACFFTIGATVAGKSEQEYTRITYDITIAAATVLARNNPGMKFIFVSGKGTDSTERGRIMWARVKGRAENALLAMPLDTYVFRPGIIQPMHGITSRTPAYRLFYRLTRPILPLVVALFPGQATTTDRLGAAMLRVAKHGAPKRILESIDFNER